MKLKSFNIFFVIFALILIPNIGLTGDMEDLKAAYGKFVADWNKHDGEQIVSAIHEKWIGLSSTDPFIAEGKDNYRNWVTSVLSAAESLQVFPKNVEFRLVGDVGIALGYYYVAFKLKDGPMESEVHRFITVFTKVQDKWVITAGSDFIF